MKDDNEKRGGRNLIILGLSASAIAILSTIASLQIYRSTGDIYLDRSRPGFISDGEKHNEEDDQKESFPNEGEVKAETIDEYLREFNKVTDRIQAADDFDGDPLTDESLMISPDETMQD